MKRKIFSVLFALVLVLSFTLMPAMPASAATTYTVDDDWQIGVPPYVEDTDGDNDFATIQAAINAASSGDTINVAAGTYTEYLHITTDGLTIEGAGIDQSIIDLDSLTPYWHYPGDGSFASRAGVLISGYQSTDEIVEDVTFRGFTVKNAGLNPPITASGTHTGSDNVAILTDSSASWTPGALVDQWVHNYGDRDTDYNPARSYGQIVANDATTVTATLSGGMDADWDAGDQYIVTSYEHFYDGWGDGQEDIPGIAIANGKNILIQYCKAENNGKYGISAGKARKTTLVQSEDVTIDNCVAVDNADNGISVGDHTGTVTITNNTATNNGSPHTADPTREYQGVGIQVSGKNSSKVISGTISGNTVHNNGYIGILLSKWVDGVTVENNTVTGHNRDQDGAGIFFYYGGYPERSKNVLVRNNTVTGNIRGIVAYYASYSTIEGNTITTDSGSFPEGQAAIKLDNANHITVRDNTISCDGTGITVAKSHDNTFTGNTIKNAKFAGVLIWGGSAYDNTFTANTITGTTSLTLWAGSTWEETQADGVFLDDDAGTGNVFHYNSIYGNADDGMENQIASTVVDATINWWGDVSGPYDPSDTDGLNQYNPDGLGDPVSEYVLYDPWIGQGGMVTGGGWIMSPAGAYTADPDLSGKATFGFVSRYKKGAAVPTGNTRFNFQVADLNFHSDSYDWLVIAGEKAMYKGTGTINGAGDYGFMLSAVDSDIDKFRIKIWDKATDSIIYDNQVGGPDGTELGGGRIVIHKVKGKK